MSEYTQVQEFVPQFTRSRQLSEASELEASVLYAQHGRVPDGFSNLYTRRNLGAAPELNDRFDEQGQEIYDGLDPKTVFFPPAKQEQYRQDNPDVPAGELEEAAGALNDHGARSLQAARQLFDLPNMVWLGLASGADHVLLQGGTASNKELPKTQDDLGWFMRSPATDVGIVGPKKDDEGKLTLAMGVADCLAIPLVDTRTKAFAFAHAGRPGTGLRTAEIAARGLSEEYGSEPQDIVAVLGEGVCMDCYSVDEHTLDGFIKDFGGRTEVDKVVAQYSASLKEVAGAEGKRYAVDLYAFNKYLLASQDIGEIIVAANCTARMAPSCQALAGGTVPAERSQQYFSHERAKSKSVGWTANDGGTVVLPTYLLTTPRNLAVVTRF